MSDKVLIAVDNRRGVMGEIQQDPSMEEILASIKRVIAEDGRVVPAPDRPRARAASTVDRPVPEDDVLELDDPVNESEADSLLSSDAASASRERLAALSALRGRGDPAAEPGALEAVVREMLRPILKAWLDEHLPAIVEQLVTREIARITGRSL